MGIFSNIATRTPHLATDKKFNKSGMGRDESASIVTQNFVIFC
jgi:hypothetical protein